MLDIIIPTKGNLSYLYRTILSIKDKTVSTPYHIYICDTGSTEDEISDIRSFLKRRMPKGSTTLILYTYYNFAKINNHAISNFSKSKYILLCNNDIELIDNCIDRMFSVITRDSRIGTVGCRLLYSDKTIQHAGQIAYIRQDHLQITHRGKGTVQKFSKEEEVMGNTGGFMMISKKAFEDMGLFNDSYIECFEDVELNWKLISNGYKNIYIDDVSAYHFESMTRDEGSLDVLFDYSKRLIPFFQELDIDTQKRIFNYCKDHDLFDTMTSASTII